MKNVELLAPAGGMSQLRTALRFGADAVYVGLKAYSLRAYANNIDLEMLREAIDLTHAQGRKIYVALNTFPWDEEFDGLLATGQRLYEMGADAAIVSDPGVVAAFRSEIPGLQLHLSTQANTVNARAAAFWHAQGVSRIILARELSLDRIAAMRQALPETLELEAFVHGAMCFSYSGRCLLSAALLDRSANQGRCAQPCRWPWRLASPERTEETLILQEDERGTYIMSAPDLCMLEHLPQLINAGISTLKIEGRMKNDYYVASVVSAYRQALEHPERAAALRHDLEKTSHRLMNTGFFFGSPQPVGGDPGPTQSMECIAVVTGIVPGGVEVILKNRFFIGDAVEALTPKGVHCFNIEWMKKGDEELPSCGVPETRLTINAPEGLAVGDILRAQARNHSPRTKPASSN